MGNIIDIDFHGDRLQGVEDARGSLIYLKPIVESMKLDWSSQLKRLRRDPILKGGMVVMTIPPELGGENDAVFLELTLFHGWLFKVQPSRVKPELRPKLLRYQRDAYRVLFEAFGPGQGSRRAQSELPAPTSAVPTELAIRMVTEARHSFDRYVGREVWFATGLLVTPGMRTAPYQGSLFTYSAERRP